MFRLAISSVAIAIAALVAAPGYAVTLSVESYVPSSVSTTCANGACDTKTSYAFYDPTVVTTSSDGFGFYQKAFNNWNAANPADGKWTLAKGNDLGANAPLYLYLTAHATDTVNANDPANRVAGAQIILSANQLQGAAAWSTGTYLNGYGWSQAISSSFITQEIAARGQGAPYHGLDYTTVCADGTTQCGPLYPYQYTAPNPSVRGITNGLFYDNPEGPYPSTLFQAQSWITSADYSTRTLTAYDGVAWGFSLTETLAPDGALAATARLADPADLPEPSTLASLMAGIVGLCLIRVISRSAHGREALG